MLKFDNVKSSNASKPHAKDAKEDDEKEEEVVVVVDGQTFLLLFFRYQSSLSATDGRGCWK